MFVTGKKFSKARLSRVINGDDAVAIPPPPPEKIRLDRFLVQKYPDFNRSILQKFIKNGCVKVNGRVVKKANFSLSGTEKVELKVPQSRKTLPRPPVLFENSRVLVLAKPAGMLSVSKGAYCPETTLADFGLIVHRLDRDTSGVVILARDAEAQSYLRRQFQERKAHKTYYAVVHGTPQEPQALIDLPIARNLKRPSTFRVEAGGKAAQTVCEVVARTAEYSLLRLRPRTGRTHQLRVHLSYLGTPIVGDRVYGIPTDCGYATPANQVSDTHADRAGDTSAGCLSGTVAGHASKSAPPRLFLHAYSLEITIITDAGTRERRVFTSPLPAEFADFFAENGIWTGERPEIAGKNMQKTANLAEKVQKTVKSAAKTQKTPNLTKNTQNLAKNQRNLAEKMQKTINATEKMTSFAEKTQILVENQQNSAKNVQNWAKNRENSQNLSKNVENSPKFAKKNAKNAQNSAKIAEKSAKNAQNSAKSVKKTAKSAKVPQNSPENGQNSQISAKNIEIPQNLSTTPQNHEKSGEPHVF